MRFAFCWVLGRGLFLASGEAVEIDRVLSEHIGALHRIKFSEALCALLNNLRVKPAAGLWARREFWIRLAGIVFIPLPSWHF